jgi:hypothetical protein
VLPVSTLLLALVAKHRTEVPHLYWLGELVEPVLDVGTHHPGCPLRPQRELPSALIVKDEHLLAHDIRGFTDAPDVQSSLLEDGQAYLRVTIAPEEIAGDLLYPRP